MAERPDIELSRERGEWIELPKGPLDRPRTLWLLMALFGGMTGLTIIMGFVSPSPWFAVATAIFAFLTGVAFVGRFPALFFRRDRN